MRTPLLTLATTFLASSLIAGNAFAIPMRNLHSKQAAPQESLADRKARRMQAQNAAEAKASIDNFTLTVTGFENGKRIPRKYTYCIFDQGKTRDSDNISPGLKWSVPPAGTRSFALLVVDKDVPASFEKANVAGQKIRANEPRRDFYHWVVADIPANVTGILEGFDSNGIVPGGKAYGTKSFGIDGKNDYSLMSEGPHGGYDGPCPPVNDERIHNYRFILYALDIPSLRLPNPITGKQVEIAIRDHIIAQSEYVGTFTTNPDWRKRRPTR